MKKFLLFLFLSFQIGVFAQVELPKDLVFDKTFFEAENQYIMLSPNKSSAEAFVGLAYFDDSAGFSFRLLGMYSPETKTVSLADSNGITLVRWENLGAKVAVVPQNLVAEWKLPEVASFLKNYKSSKPAKELLVDKLSFANGAGLYETALTGLLKLKNENYKSEKFYFELAFSYNALGKFADAEKIITEAESNGLKNELLVKEKHYSLLHQNKTSEAGDYLKNNFSNFKNKNYLSESIINQTLFYYNSKDFQNAEKWIANYRKEIGTDQYVKHIDSIENNIKQQKVQ